MILRTSVEVEIAGADISVAFEFEYVAGCPEQGPSHGSGGEPATAAEISITKATLNVPEGGKLVDVPAPGWLVRLFEENSHIMEALEEHANEGPDPDDARDRQIERD
jgi:hypothetical protein